jgi:hypothetical protein
MRKPLLAGFLGLALVFTLTNCSGSSSISVSSARIQFAAIGEHTYASLPASPSEQQVTSAMNGVVSQLQNDRWPSAAMYDVMSLQIDLQSLVSDEGDNDATSVESDQNQGQADADKVWHDLGGNGEPPGWQFVPSYVLPAPDGYALSTDSGVVNGPISPQDFDKTVGAGAASSTHFVRGYDVTYDSNSSDESIESTLLTFASAADASGFAPQVLGSVGAASLSPTRSSLSSIPGSVLLRGTRAGSDGYYVIDVVTQKGPTIMVVEYSNDSAPRGVPDVLSTSASKQYALI